MECVPSEDSDQPRHPPSLIRVFAVCKKKHWDLSYPLGLSECPGWSESSLGAVILLVLSWGGLNAACGFSGGFPLKASVRFHLTYMYFIGLAQTEWNEPCHEIMVLFVLGKLILQTDMRSHPAGLDIWCLVGPFVYFHTSCVRTAKALARLCGCAGSPEPSLVASVIRVI